MELFNKKFVYFVWDNTLIGKKGFFADDIDDLCERVNSNVTGYYDEVSESYQNAFPFERGTIAAPYRFFYHDPNYECKIAYTKGKRVQFRTKGSKDVWLESDFAPRWNDELDYRIKPESGLMTYRQLAEWLAKGNGQYRPRITTDMSYSYMTYNFTGDDAEIPEDYVIRKWGSDEWIEPTVDVYDDAFRTKEEAAE